MKTIAFFNNKGGVGKTSLVYHLAHMYADLGVPTLAVDLDPQANLTAMCVDEDRLEELWPDGEHPSTVFGAIKPLLEGTGDVATPHVEEVTEALGLLVGDLSLSATEDDLSSQWPDCLDRKPRAFRVISAFWRVIELAAQEREAALVLIDVGPNLGAINRAAMIAADHVVIPLAPDLFSLQGLRNLGPTLRRWRDEWAERKARNPVSELSLPPGGMDPSGYVVLQHAVRLDRPVKAYGRWIERIPDTYRSAVQQKRLLRPLSVEQDRHCLAALKHYRSLMPLAQDATEADVLPDACRRRPRWARRCRSRLLPRFPTSRPADRRTLRSRAAVTKRPQLMEVALPPRDVGDTRECPPDVGPGAACPLGSGLGGGAALRPALNRGFAFDTPPVLPESRAVSLTAAVAPESAPPADARLQAEFDQLFSETAVRLERIVAIVGMVTAGIALLVTEIGHALGVALGTYASWGASAFILYYAAVFLVIRAGRYRPWLRYVSSFVDVSLATLIYVSDETRHGWLFSVAAAGPTLYMLTVGAAALRLDPRLCLYAGAVAMTQFLVASFLVVLPESDPAHDEMLRAAGFLTVIRGSFILALGVFGAIASQSMRGLLFRLTWSAVERARVRGLFGMYVSEEIVDLIIAGGIREGGERRSVTVVFSDIRDFTRLSESKPPEEVVLLLNLYFERMCGVVARHGGAVNKFLGDGMLIVFGTPALAADDSRRALACAQEMVAEAARMSDSGEFPRLRIGVGLHRGETVLGNVGGSQRQEYTVIGDTVNTASRVQDLTKQLDRSILFTSAVRETLLREPVEALGWFAVKGREGLIELYAPPEPAAEAAPEPPALELKPA